MGIFSNMRSWVSKSVLGQSVGSFAWGWSKPGTWSKQELLRQYKQYVHTIVSALAEDCAQIVFTVKNRTTEEPIKNHPFLILMERPNPMQSKFQFLEFHFTFMEICGESFWYKTSGSLTNKTTEFFLLRPDQVTVVIADDDIGSVKGYVLHKPNGIQVPFEPEEIIHHKLVNLVDPSRGSGPLEAGAPYVQTEEYLSDWTKNAVFNSGRPSGMLSLKKKVSADQFALIKKRFKQEHEGTKNAGKTMFVNGMEGFDYTKIGMELAELALGEIKDLSKADIMFMWRVSKTMLGISDDVNLANAREAKKIWSQNLIAPKQKRLVDHLQAFVMPEYGDNVVLSSEDPSPDTNADKVDEWQKGLNNWLTSNEIRKERGLDPLPGGDVLYQSLALVPVTAGSEVAPDLTSPTDTPPENPPATDTPQKQARKELSRIEKAEIFRKNLFKQQAMWVNKYQEACQKVFNAQLDEILNRNAKAFEEWTFDNAKSLERFKKLLNPITIELMKMQGGVALSFAGDTETEFMVTPRMIKYINDRVTRFATNTDKQTTSELQATLTEGYKSGENAVQLAKRVKDVYQATPARAERIARTETIASSNQAAQEAYRQSPIVVSQEWYAEPDSCEFCQALNGTVIGLSESFAPMGSVVTGVDGGEMVIDYDSIDHPPEHPNCQCTILPVNGD